MIESFSLSFFMVIIHSTLYRTVLLYTCCPIVTYCISFHSSKSPGFGNKVYGSSSTCICLSAYVKENREVVMFLHCFHIFPRA